MPLIQHQKNQKNNLDLPRNQFSRRGLNTLDVPQLEYSAQTLFKYGTILFLVVGVLASVTYMTVQQLKK